MTDDKKDEKNRPSIERLGPDKTGAEKWDEKYYSGDFLYGLTPNSFLATRAVEFKPNARILSLGEGEGRNAIYLASLGHEVTAIDYSEVGLEKAYILSKHRGVPIKTIVADITTYDLGLSDWDVVISIFCHLPSVARPALHDKIISSLAPFGMVLMELYNPKQIEATSSGRAVGGPKDLDLLITKDELQRDFGGLKIIHLTEMARELNEGTGHTGMSEVVQLFAKS